MHPPAHRIGIEVAEYPGLPKSVKQLPFKVAEARMLDILSRVALCDREDLFSALKRAYCLDCGRKQPAGLGCQCWNDV